MAYTVYDVTFSEYNMSYCRSKESNYSTANGGNFTFVQGKQVSLPNDTVSAFNI